MGHLFSWLPIASVDCRITSPAVLISAPLLTSLLFHFHIPSAPSCPSPSPWSSLSSPSSASHLVGTAQDRWKASRPSQLFPPAAHQPRATRACDLTSW